MAADSRTTGPGSIIHSDHGSRFTSWGFSELIRTKHLVGSMGTVGDCYDNAPRETFWGTLQIELLNRKKWRTKIELSIAIAEWIEHFYNPERLHSSLGYVPPWSSKPSTQHDPGLTLTSLARKMGSRSDCRVRVGVKSASAKWEIAESGYGYRMADARSDQSCRLTCALCPLLRGGDSTAARAIKASNVHVDCVLRTQGSWLKERACRVSWTDNLLQLRKTGSLRLNETRESPLHHRISGAIRGKAPEGMEVRHGVIEVVRDRSSLRVGRGHWIADPARGGDAASTPPTIVLPAVGATVSRTDVVLDATAPTGTTSVEYKVFAWAGLSHAGLNAPVAYALTPSQYGWFAYWNTTDVPNGSYDLYAVATVNGTSDSSPVSTVSTNVTVDNPPPSVSIGSPAQWSDPQRQRGPDRRCAVLGRNRVVPLDWNERDHHPRRKLGSC